MNPDDKIESGDGLDTNPESNTSTGDGPTDN